jgi:hypothetical protein
MDFFTPIILFVATLAIVSDAFLFAGMLDRLTAIFALLLSGIVAFVLTYIDAQAPDDDDVPRASRLPVDGNALALHVMFVLASVAFFKILFTHPITVAVRTPWTALPPEIFVAFGVMAMSSLAAPAKAWIRSVMAFAFLGLTALAFPLGYGFDSFLHRTAEDFIVQNGFINPLPILYGGQYALIATLHHLTSISVDLLDRFLVPALAALFLGYHARAKENPLTWAVMFLLPLSVLTLTTPFAFATLLFLAVVMLCADGTRQTRLLIALPIAIAAAAVHMLAGIPALIVVALSLLKHPKHLALGSFVGALLVPVMMFARVMMSGAPVSLVPDFSQLSSLIQVALPTTTFRFFEDFAYLIGVAIVGLFVFFAGIGMKRKQQDESLTSLLASTFAFALSGFLLSMIRMPDVISYEQADYARRLLLLASLALAPFVFLGFQDFANRLNGKSSAVRVGALTFLVLVAVGHFYLLYPRADRHETNKGFNVSQSDFDAVKSVMIDAHGKPFVLLAPQTTSAAYVRSFGFPADNRTLAIPTGAPLYQYFVAMTEQIDPKAVPGAMEFTEQRLGYVLLPTWWWRFEEIKKPLDAIASGSYSVGDVTIWKFEKR